MENIEQELKDLTTAAKKLGAKEFAYLISHLIYDNKLTIEKLNEGLQHYVDHCGKE